MALGSRIDTHFFRPTRWGQGVGLLIIIAACDLAASQILS
jgi:hypothetical protein